MKISQYLQYSGILLAVFLGISWLLGSRSGGDLHMKVLAAAFILNYILTAGAFSLTYRGLKKSHNQFMAVLFAGLTGKMLLSLLAILTVAFIDRSVLKEFAVSYLIGYVLFTGFEVYSLMLNLRHNSK